MKATSCVGKLFRNSYKQQDKHPDTKGDMQINLDELFGPGVAPPRVLKLEMAGWTYKTQSGDDYQSLKIQLPREKSVQRQDGPARDLEGSIPF